MNNENRLIIAKKYAQAFINIFKKKLVFDDLKKLESFSEYLRKNRNIFVYAKLSLIDISVKKEVFDKLLSSFNLGDFFSDLVNLLIKHNRISLLPEVLDNIIKIYKNDNNIMEFNVISSDKLTENRLNLIKTFLSNKTQKDIIIKEKIDPNLIAGLKIYSDEFEWQNSIRHQLNLLERS